MPTSITVVQADGTVWTASVFTQVIPSVTPAVTETEVQTAVDTAVENTFTPSATA